MEDTKKTLTLNTTKITNHYMITRTTIANKLQCFGKGLRTIRASIGSGEKGEGRTTRACRQGPTIVEHCEVIERFEETDYCC